jgi:hypothetical protein
MAIVNIENVKAKFESGDNPRSSDYIDMIDTLAALPEGGNIVLNGVGAPSAETGLNGDFYINSSNYDIYGPKTSGSWGSATSLVGPTGATGPGFTYQGEWNGTTHGYYYVGDVVTYQGSTYICVNAVYGNGTPDVDASFNLYISKGDTGPTGATGPQGATGATGASASDLTAWTSYTPTITADGGGFSIGNGVASGRYKQIGKTVFFYAKFVYGSTTSPGSGHWNFSLPVTAQNSNFTLSASILDSGVAWYGGIGNGNYTGSTTSFAVNVTSPDAGVSTWVVVGNGGPFTWGDADNITISGSYESV